ncbi:MAG: hypothetical protein LBP19_10950 [Treponema sp.]|nr:hypothetical protein [Treponema sp.]
MGDHHDQFLYCPDCGGWSGGSGGCAIQGVEGNISLQRVAGGTGGDSVAPSSGVRSGRNVSTYRGSRGLDPEVIAEIEKRYGFDKPFLARYGEMLKKYSTFNFGDSLFRGRPMLTLIAERLPVSISLGLWSTLINHIPCSIPLGIRKAVKNGTRFDTWTKRRDHSWQRHTHFLFAVLLVRCHYATLHSHAAAPLDCHKQPERYVSLSLRLIYKPKGLGVPKAVGWSNPL